MAPANSGLRATPGLSSSDQEGQETATESRKRRRVALAAREMLAAIDSTCSSHLANSAVKMDKVLEVCISRVQRVEALVAISPTWNPSFD